MAGKALDLEGAVPLSSRLVGASELLSLPWSMEAAGTSMVVTGPVSLMSCGELECCARSD